MIRFISLSFLVLLFAFEGKAQCSHSHHKYDKEKSLYSDTIDVKHYEIVLDISDFGNEQIFGYTEIDFEIKQNSIDNLTFELWNLSVDSVLLENTLLNFTQIDKTIRVSLTSQMNTGDTSKIKIYYGGHPMTDPTGWGGFDYSSGVAYNLGVGFGADPHNLGKAWFPCIDDFIDRASYSFKITTKPEHTAVCTGVLENWYYNVDSTKKTFEWRLDNEIPTYLASVAVGNYVAVRDTFNLMNGQIPSAIYVKPNSVANAEASFINLGIALDGFEERFGPYVWPRVGYVATPVGAMEHPTNVAYPIHTINGTLAYETLWAHELSHHWFGDLITCASAEDMWINEGWAVFCEAVFTEILYGKQAYKDYVRKNHWDVISKTHKTDDGYRALYGIPTEYTYGSTVYDKGGDIVHTLRGYLGDSLFFNLVTQYLNHFAYNHVSSWDLRDFLTDNSQFDLTDFFEAYVFTPGFYHFSIDSTIVTENSGVYNIEVFVKQKLHHSPQFANSNRLELVFFNENWEKHYEIFEFSGEFGNQSFQLNFEPILILLDAEEKISDATTDEYKVISQTGSTDFDESIYFKIETENINDSAFLRITHNWVAPDSMLNDSSYILTNCRFWTVEGILPQDFIAKGKFYYNKTQSMDLDYNFLDTAKTDSLVLMFRENRSEYWQEIPFERDGISFYGNLICDTLKTGEYAFGLRYMKEGNSSGITVRNSIDFEVFPNPSDSFFTFRFQNPKKARLEISNITGKIVYSYKINRRTNELKWNCTDYDQGVYIVRIIKNNKVLNRSKIIIE